MKTKCFIERTDNNSFDDIMFEVMNSMQLYEVRLANFKGIYILI